MSANPDAPVYEVAVVGAAGFLGAAVMNRLRATGVPAVGFTLDRLLLSARGLDRDAYGVKTVIWCASRINPKLAVEEPARVAEDLHDLKVALDEFATWSRAPRIVTFSSGGTVYGPPAVPPYRESDQPHPVNAYGEAKLAFEEQVRASGLPSVALRVANAYGPGQRPAPGQGVIAHWIEAILASQPLQLYGHPDDTRDYVYVDDIASAAVAAHMVDAPPAVVNIGSGVATTLDDLLEALRPAVAPLDFEVVRHPPRTTDTAHSTLDSTLARTGLGWEPTTSLADGVAAQWRWRTGA